MQVETYETVERDENGQIMDMPEEALAIIEELGLEGQRKFLRATGEDGNIQTIPYRRMTKDEAAVYGTLMPKRSDIESYNAGQIPIRVLEVVKECKPMFKKLVIWYPETEADLRKDPILVGVNERTTVYYPGEKNEWTHREDENYLLARWGEELLPLEQLAAKAGGRAKRAVLSALKSIEAQVRERIAMYSAVEDSEFVMVHTGAEPSFYDQGKR